MTFDEWARDEKNDPEEFNNRRDYARAAYEAGQRDAVESESARINSATHRCTTCGALWRLYPPSQGHCNRAGCCWCLDGAWSVVTPGIMGKCCDNAAMGDQIVALRSPPTGYPCDRCGKLVSKAEGGNVFSVCESCWSSPPTGGGE